MKNKIIRTLPVHSEPSEHWFGFWSVWSVWRERNRFCIFLSSFRKKSSNHKATIVIILLWLDHTFAITVIIYCYYFAVFYFYFFLSFFPTDAMPCRSESECETRVLSARVVKWPGQDRQQKKMSLYIFAILADERGIA